MWEDLPIKDKQEYQRLILSFASLTEMFTQKAESNAIPSPIINSKFQETVFQKIFNATGEDIGNTSYDISLKLDTKDGTVMKYLVGIKTFGIGSGDQKIAQFKSNHGVWAPIIDKIEKNAFNDNGVLKSKEEINLINSQLYMDLAKKIAVIRNQRIDSSQENLRGFDIKKYDNVCCVYHVLMPSLKGDEPKIYVGETAYNKIDIDNIKICGCSSPKKPSNFTFYDGKHIYRYTSADSQLLMKFNNRDIITEQWNVVYAEDAYEIFSDIGNKIYGEIDTNNEIIESYSWSLLNNNGDTELFSGFNNFYGVGSKLSKVSREPRINKLYNKYKNINEIQLNTLKSKLRVFLLEKAQSFDEKMKKIELREEIRQLILENNNLKLIEDVNKLIYRPMNEMYIPIPNSKTFHLEHPDFFGENIAKFKLNEDGKETAELLFPPEKRRFTLTFEPSGDSIVSYITQDNGKAIESVEKQSYLGEWVLRKVFQLQEYEPLTKEKLDEIGINGIRLYKKRESNNVFLEFIWIDSENLPDDFIK